MSFAFYLVGYLILIAGLAYGAYMMHVPQRWIDSGMRHQSLRLRALLDFLLDRLGQFRDRRIQSIHQLQQIVPSPAGPRSQAK